MKKIGHYLFYLIEIAIVFALYTTLQEFYFYPDIFGFGSAEAFTLALSTVLVFWFSFWLWFYYFFRCYFWDRHGFRLQVYEIVLVIFARFHQLNGFFIRRVKSAVHSSVLDRVDE